jgi:hypothetical protein
LDVEFCLTNWPHSANPNDNSRQKQSE